MKRSTANWTTAIAASALLAVPVGAMAQQTSRPATTQPAPSPKTSRPAGTDTAQQGSANEHLRQAEAALNDIPAASLTGTAKTRVAELKRHLTALGNSPSGSRAGATGAAARGKANWSTDVAAADRIVTELLGASGTTGAAAPAATGTTGATTPSTTRSKTATAITLDDTSRAKLQEVRTHLTAFAASMSGTGGAAPTPSSDDPSAAASASTSATPAASAQATPGAPAEASATTESTAPASQPAAPAASTAARATGQVDTDTVKKHLTSARETLSQLTQLPAAAQLAGDARTQVSELISNFNELITTETSWRASYAKVQANLASLVGDQRADESAAPAAGTPGAVGTSGTTTLDAGVRAKLVEFRTHLMEFEKAAGGGASTASSSTATAPGSAPPATATASPDAPATAAASTTPPAATSSSTPVGTSGRTPAAAASSSPTPASETAASPEHPSASAQATGSQGMRQQTEVMRHIDAIEAILNGGSGAVGTTGSADTKDAKPAGTGRATLDRAQMEQIRTHLSDLRKALATRQ